MIPPSTTAHSPNRFPQTAPADQHKRLDSTGLSPNRPFPTAAASVRFGKVPADVPFSPMAILKTINAHFWEHNNPEVAKAFAYKYGSDVGFSLLFASPIGWIPGLLAIPFSRKLSNKGEKQLEAYIKDPKYQNHPAIKAENIVQYWGKNEGTSIEGMVQRWNDFVDALLPEKNANQNVCPHNARVRNAIKINDKVKSGNGYQLIERLVNAKLALKKSLLRFVTWPFDKLHDGLAFLQLPRPLRRIFKIPNYIMFGLFFLLKRKPPIPKV